MYGEYVCQNQTLQSTITTSPVHPQSTQRMRDWLQQGTPDYVPTKDTKPVLSEYTHSS
jgi:hypothetical protein